MTILVGISACDNNTVNNNPPSLGEVKSTALPNGLSITPTAAPGSSFMTLNPGLADFPNFVAGQAMSEALSPDQKTLLVLTSGYNLNLDAKGSAVPADSMEYVFVYDVSAGTPIKKQVLMVPNTFAGITFSPDGSAFYVTGGVDDTLHTYALSSGQWAESGTPIALNHNKIGVGIAQQPLAAGVAVTADGKHAVVADMYNDSITVVDLVARSVSGELDLRPGKSGGTSGTPGGESPLWVQIVGNNTAYVSSERDREVVVADLTASAPVVKARIAVRGNPLKMVLNKAQTRLYVAVDNADVVSVIDTTQNVLLSDIPVVMPPDLAASQNLGSKVYRGASPNAVALSPDENTLYVADGGTNTIAVIALNQSGTPVTGLIPTGWFPQSVAVGANGGMLYVTNSHSVPGPNPGNCLGYGAPCQTGNPSTVTLVENQYILTRSKAGLQSIPTPSAPLLGLLTKQVITNDSLASNETAQDKQVMQQLAQNIQHVIYIIKENRTYDQILGDVGKGNSDPSLAEFGQPVTPNLHAMASNFVTFDNYYDPGEVSGNGWPWSTSARESDDSGKTLPVNYAGRGASYDWEGTNRNINVALTGAARTQADPLTPQDADVLPGTGNVAAPDGPDGEVQQGYLWSAALRKNLSVRNYGFFCDLTRYSAAVAQYGVQIPLDRTPYADNTTVAYAANKELVGLTDPYFRGFDDAYPDFYREAEWEREFNSYVTNKNLPSLSLVRFMNDHTGSFSTAIDGVNTPELQIADNDYAVGKLIQAVANSPYKSNTLIFVVEDDAQDGPDHVDAHRSTAYIVGPYMKKNALVQTHYSTVNLLRTIEDILGLDQMSVYDEHQGPMTDAFDLTQTTWTFRATPSQYLASTQLPLTSTTGNTVSALKPRHDVHYWAARTRGFDFGSEDKLDAVAYNRLLWQGIVGTKYPAQRSQYDFSVRHTADIKTVSAKTAEPGGG
jgi:DNA-binding beta-propeller fold protein YncE